MAPKKDKKGKAVEEEKKKETFAEVDRVFLELELAECNKKVARLKTAVDEYEVRNEELQKQYNKLDEDRADIISYLKKTLNVKNDEINELKEKVRGLEEIREIETKQFNEKIDELQKNVTIMKDQLTSENKLLSGKLNSLEEFRAIRDDLLKKFEKQEQDFKDQEMKYKRIIYDAEKKFIIGKDKLKKEMEARLLKLAQDFQDATELRIAASTHRVIRENIAINNELDSILTTQTKLADQNEKFRESERNAKLALQVAEMERDKAIDRNIVQLKVIDKLTKSYEDIKYQKALYEKRTFDFDAQQKKIEKLSKENDKLSYQVRILEQNLHADMSNKNVFNVEANKTQKENDKLKFTLKQAAIAIKAALKLDEWASEDRNRELMDRQSLLNQLLDIISKHRETEHADSVATLASFGRVYEEGDLGFVPKSSKSKPSTAATSEVISRAEKEIVEEEESSKEASTTSLGSFATIPSMHVLPPKSHVEIPMKESLPSLVSSSKSTESEAIVVEEEEPEMHAEAAISEAPAAEGDRVKAEVSSTKSDELGGVEAKFEVGETEVGEESLSEERGSEAVGEEYLGGEETKEEDKGEETKPDELQIEEAATEEPKTEETTAGDVAS